MGRLRNARKVGVGQSRGPILIVNHSQSPKLYHHLHCTLSHRTMGPPRHEEEAHHPSTVSSARHVGTAAFARANTRSTLARSHLFATQSWLARVASAWCAAYPCPRKPQIKSLPAVLVAGEPARQEPLAALVPVHGNQVLSAPSSFQRRKLKPLLLEA